MLLLMLDGGYKEVKWEGRNTKSDVKRRDMVNILDEILNI